MAYINVAEWTASHVGDWLRGLDDSILPYTLFFVNNQINGCRLLLLTPEDLIKLNVKKIGHQEIILEAVELLKQLHYNFTSETLQTVCLRLACKSRSLFNQLKQSALSAKNDSSNINSSQSPTSSGSGFSDDSRHADETITSSGKGHKKYKHKDKDKDKDNKNNVDQSGDMNGSDKRKKGKDMSRISTSTLFSVGDILTAVKDFICWIDRAPFDGQTTYVEARSKILKISIELASTAQRDQFVQAPNEVIKNCCKELADLSDTLVQQLSDSLSFQCAQLEVVTVTKKVQEELGMFIHSSYSGVHVVSGLKYESPAQKNGQLEEGDEIVQVNYRTVVGWQLKKLVASMRQFPSKIILTVKKRPRHSNNGSASFISPFSLPVHDVFCQQQQQQQQHYSSQLQTPYYSQNYMQTTHLQQPQQTHHSDNQFETLPMDVYRTLPNPVMPVITAEDPHLSNVENVYNPLLYNTLPSHQTQTNLQQQQQQQSQQQQQQQSQQKFYHSSVSSSGHNNNNNNNSNVLEANKYRSNQIYGINCEALSEKESSNNRFTKSQPDKPLVSTRPVHTKKRKSRIATTRCSSASEQDFDAQDTDSDFSFTSEDDTANFSSTDDDQINDNSCHRNQLRTGNLDVNKKLKPQYSGPGSTSSGTSSAIDPIICENSSKQSFESHDLDSGKADDELDDSDSAFYSIGNSNSVKRTLNNADKRLSPLLSTNKSSSPTDKDLQIIQTKASITTSKTKHKIPETCASKTPRTSAEFEALYLQKECTTTSSLIGENVENNNQDKSKDKDHPQLSSVHLSTISHLTSLAANIRFAANTPTSIATPIGITPNRSTHNTAQFDEPLAMRIKSSLERLTNDDTEMGDHQDFLYIYKGREQTQNKDKASERLPSLGPMVYDPKQDNKWTKIHATLKENCLFTNQVSSDIQDIELLQDKDKDYQFEIPVHLPGYYILVNKTDILSTSDKKITGGNIADGNPNTVLLYVFKLVTYHHLYLFGVESTAKLARWICKFGYRYCCNPSDSHLCFTYYLSSTHVEPKVISTRLSVDDSNCSPINHKTSSEALLETENENDKNQPDETESQYSCTSNPNTLPNTESELSSDDYLDLSLNASRNRVKFDSNLNGITESFGENDSISSEVSDHRKFAKSPHPGARFSVKATSDCVEFVETKLANEDLEKVNANIARKVPPQLPPRSSSVSSINSTSTTSGTGSRNSPSEVLPRPRPRISKMNTSTSDRDSESSPKTTPTKPILPPKGPFLNANERSKHSSSPVNRQELPPISVPEKSAAISQTIQHFANLQRQNVLRRSNQQLLRATEKAEKEKDNKSGNTPAKNISTLSSSNQKTLTPKVEEKDNKTVSDYDYITSNTSTNLQKKQLESSPIGNPLYHSIANIVTPLQKQNQTLPDVICSSTSSNSSSSASSSSNSDSHDSPPPPTINPPPAPPVVRECLLKPSSLFSKFDKLSLNDNEKDKENIKLQESSVDCDFQIFNMNGKIINSPKISPRRMKNSMLPEESPKELPPILPRRSNIPKKTPPPIPTTAHPSKNNRPSVFTFDTPPEIPRTERLSNVLEADIPILLPANKQMISSKSLNRSFSDAYVKSPTGRVRPRKSLESGLPLNALIDHDEDQNSPGVGVAYNPNYFSQNTPMSPAQLVAGNSTSDLNNSNRSLPTMGVSMLGKKRLSNVSADCYAIKEALNLFENNSDWSTSRNNSLTSPNR